MLLSLNIRHNCTYSHELMLIYLNMSVWHTCATVIGQNSSKFHRSQICKHWNTSLLDCKEAEPKMKVNWIFCLVCT